MKQTKLVQSTMALTMALSLAASVRAADDPVRPGRPAIPENLREQWQKLSPEERQARIREFREQHPDGLLPKEMEKRREELKGLSPEERQAKLKEWRENRGDRPLLRDLSPQEREAKRKELQQRFEKHHAELLKKKADGSVTPQEERRLQRMEELAKRFEQGGPRPRPFPPRNPQGDPPERPASTE